MENFGIDFNWFNNKNDAIYPLMSCLDFNRLDAIDFITIWQIYLIFINSFLPALVPDNVYSFNY
jgi:hypothetical protein